MIPPQNPTVSSFQYGLFLHELGHTIGLDHEHQHPDRDSEIVVNMKNVSKKMRAWFRPSSHSFNSLGMPYDIQSVMHYGEKVIYYFYYSHAEYVGLLHKMSQKSPSKNICVDFTTALHLIFFLLLRFFLPFLPISFFF